MPYENLEELRTVEDELIEVDRLLEQESDERMKAAIQTTAAALGAGTAGGVGGGVALYFAGVVGFSAPGITSGLAAIGALVGGGMLAGIAVLAAAPVALAGGGFFIARHLRMKKFQEARKKLRDHAVARRNFLTKLINQNQDLTEKIAIYKYHLTRLTEMIAEL